MNKNYYGTFIAFLLFFSYSVSAQQPVPVIHFANGILTTNYNISKQNFKKEDISAALFDSLYYVVIQFRSLPSNQVQQLLHKAGVELETYLPYNAYLASIQKTFDFSLAKEAGIISVNVLPPMYKTDRELIDYKPSAGKQDQQMIAVSCYNACNREKATEAIIQKGAFLTYSKFAANNIIFIQADRSIINSIATLPFVSNLSLVSLKDKPLNYNSRAAHGAGGLNAPNGKNLNGSGITIGVGDESDISSHIDFAGRIIGRTPAPFYDPEGHPYDHGVHVSGTAAGAGILNVKNRGMASRATIINQFFSDVIVNAPAYITDNKMVLTNNSYYSVNPGCSGEGKYDLLSNYIDQQMGAYPQLLHVIAAGNDGDNTCSPFPYSFGTVKSGWQSAKNVLTVGAISTNDYFTTNLSIAYFSSRGPLKDGRLKPEITSGGWKVLSSNAFNTYGDNYGTSMACPAVTGALALMYEEYRKLHGGTDPKASLMKALVCNTAEDLGNKGPDFTYGFGMLNVRKAVEAIDSNRYFLNSVSNGGNVNSTINIPANTLRLKLMLYWADTAAAINASAALVNDLDLTVTEPSSTVHQPMVLNPAVGHVSDVAVEGADHTNNIEQVVIENPATGTYGIKVNGFAVPSGPQDFVVTYEIIQPSVTVEYPCGGETWVPGEDEYIRWNAFGNEANNFTIEYSGDNGGRWTTINNNISAASRAYTWTVPATATNLGLVRVSRNGTSLTGVSKSNFIILGQPVVTATNVCEGAVQLDWPAIASASSYDIVKLVADSMQVIGNTASTSFLARALDKNTAAWLGVAAKNGSFLGRRSVSVNILPNSGSCTLTAFNNDLKVDSILTPNTARQFFSNAADATAPVKIRIRNLGSVLVTGPFTVSFTTTGGTSVTETINSSIAAGAVLDYTFTAGFTFVATGFKYDFKAWVTLVADPSHQNDTAYKRVKSINNDPLPFLPLLESFESLDSAGYSSGVTGLESSTTRDRIDFRSNTGRGRLRSFVNTGFALSGNRALTLDQAPYNDNSSTDSAIISYNFALFNASQLRLDFYYKNHGQANAPNNKVWIRGSENNAWVEAYDLYNNQASLGQWKHGLINVNDVLAAAAPPQNVTATFQVKFGQQGYTSANSVDPEIDIDDGYTFDDLLISEALNDVGAIKMNLPDKNGCALTASNPVSVGVKNYNNTVLNNLPVSYQVNNGSVVTEIIPSIAANQTLDYVFTQTADLSAYIDYNIKVWVKYPIDNYAANDSILNYTVHNSPLISSYPYLQNFESSDGNFYTKGTNSSWQWGTPMKTIIDKSASGNKAWVTSLLSNYRDNETSYLYTPCFDISGLSNPMLSFSHIFDIELDYDYSWVEYSNDGITWQKLGTPGAGTNWYDNVVGNNWRASNKKWHVASIDIPTTGTTIRFRFVLSSDGGVTMEGVGIDDIHVFDKAPVYAGIPLTGITQNVSGSNWVHFTSAGKRIASVNANGINLGAVTVQVHPYTGVVRYSNNQYYGHRNMVMQTAVPPSGNVSVRFYFTDIEADTLTKATGCSTCSKPKNAYELGITKYSGSMVDENNAIGDDSTGFFQFILPANTQIVPYDNGYYAEFTVNSFSEFWLSKASIEPLSNNNCAGNTIVYAATTGATTYQWQEDNGSGYTNISNGANYTGATSDTLRLIAVPTTHTGYKYRCVVNGSNAAERILRFKTTWTGNSNTDWFTPANWSCGIVPDQNTDVIIPGGLTNYPVLTTDAAIRSLRSHPGAPVKVNAGFKLDIKGQ